MRYCIADRLIVWLVIGAAGLAAICGGEAVAKKKVAPAIQKPESGKMLNGEVKVVSDYRQLSGNLMAYPFVDNEPPAQTPPPDGYEPFHLEHYGRHGSRWLIGDKDYSTPVERLMKARKAGKLTPLGEEVLDELIKIDSASYKRHGELTDMGAVQHEAIGRRMARLYPEIFTPGSNVDAKSTVVIRCILSMFNGLKGIMEVEPDVVVRTDASEAEMYYMNYNDSPAWKWKDEAERTALADYKKNHDPGIGYLSRLVNDPEFARDSVAPGIMPYLYWVLANTQGHSNQKWLLDKVFTPEEAHEIWLQGNAGWFLHSANSELTRHRMPYTQRNLLKNIIESTDTAVMSLKPSANLRYGHDGILVNMVTLMEIDGFGKEINNLEELEGRKWYDFDIIPKAGNLQIIFYRRPGDTNPDDVLVKVLLNETERRLPIKNEEGPYYKWSDVKKYYLDKLARFKEPE